MPGFTADMRQAAGEVVERLVVATRLRYPVVGDLARSIRYEAYERPLIEAARSDVYADVREQLQQLAAGPNPAEYAERIEALVDSPEPLIRLLAEQLTSSGPGLDADARGDDPAVLPDPRAGGRQGLHARTAGRTSPAVSSCAATGWS